MEGWKNRYWMNILMGHFWNILQSKNRITSNKNNYRCKKKLEKLKNSKTFYNRSYNSNRVYLDSKGLANVICYINEYYSR
jgi:hypothetical protein